MNHKLPIVELDEYQRLWLDEVYQVLKNNKRPTQRDIWKKLYGKVPQNFHPESIDGALLTSSGEDITVLGIIALTKSYTVLEQIDKIIVAIKEYFLKNNDKTEVQIDEIAAGLRMDPIELGFYCPLLADMEGFIGVDL